MKLKVFTDYACPFCYIGYKLVQEVADQMGIDVEYCFSEIHPEVPACGCATEDIVRGDLTKFNKHIAQLAEPFGIYPQLGKKISNSKKAIILRGYILDKHPQKIGDFDEAMYRAYLVDNLDIGDDQVLGGILTEVGIDEAIHVALGNTMANIRFELDRSTTKENYIDSIPTFMVGGRKLVGAVSQDELKAFVENV